MVLGLQPAQPTVDSIITYTFPATGCGGPPCLAASAPVITGNTITITTAWQPVCVQQPCHQTATIGRLPAGTYTLNVVGGVTESVTFDVHANVPALDSRGLGMLVIAIATAAFLALRRSMP